MSEMDCSKTEFLLDDQFDELSRALAMGCIQFLSRTNEKQPNVNFADSQPEKNSPARLDIPAMSSNL